MNTFTRFVLLAVCTTSPFALGCSPGEEAALSAGASETGESGPEPTPRPPADSIPQSEGASGWVNELCAQHGACQCSGAVEGFCDNYAWEVDYLFERAVELGLMYDGQCVGDMVADLQWQACATTDDPYALGCEAYCSPFHGDRALGESCELVSWAWLGGTTRQVQVSECAQGLVCNGGRCTNYCVATQGQDEGELCQSDSQCKENLICDGAGVDLGTCVAAPGPGEPCRDYSCRGDAFCDSVDGFSFTCQSWPTVGEPCQWGTCAWEARCDVSTDTCVPDVELGQRCAGHGDCLSGYCPNGYCWPLPRQDEACSGRCAEGLVCTNEVCRVPVAVCGEG